MKRANADSTIEGGVCRVCGTPVRAVYRSRGDVAIDSSAMLVSGATCVDACPKCTHAQTRPIRALPEYYATGYRFKSRSADEDDLCTTAGGEVIYRSAIQASLVAARCELDGRGVLDFGSGKAQTLRLLAQRHPRMRPAAFDVSESYRDYWNDFLAAEAQATFRFPLEWEGRFDVVLSFFALEHAEDPRGFVAGLAGALRPAGTAIVVLPNMYRNACDFVVVDHVNHFSPRSLGALFRSAGFRGIAIDANAQPGWYVVEATRAPDAAGETSEIAAEASAIAAFWEDAADRIRERESRDNARAAVYGSGVYGLFIASTLSEPQRLACFVDRSPFRHDLEFLGARVVPPEDLPDDVSLVYVGLNPLTARATIGSMPELQRPGRDFFFL